VSRKSIPFSFSMPARPADANRPAPDVAIDAHSDDWVSDRHARGEAKPAMAPSLMLDLAAERGLTEVFALSLIAPFALGWFWLMNAMAGRARF
jgi:hypothetical protein